MLLPPGTDSWLVGFAVAVVSVPAGAALTDLARRLALALGMLDVPGVRSSHEQPTPRGAGLAIAAIGLGITALAAAAGWLSWPMALALLGGGALIAVVSWFEDWRGVSWRWRIAAQAVAATWALAWLGGFGPLDLGDRLISLGPTGEIVALLGIMWGTNFFNFMDGIDGLAGAETVVVGGVGGVLLLAGGEPGLACVLLALAGSSVGFLRHNWTPARAFLGDVGSTYLGFTLCTVAVASANTGAVPMVVWGILLGVFVFDATVTLARRMLDGFGACEGHREHAFCRAVRAGWSHPQVTRSVVALDLLLVVLAGLGWRWPALLVPCAAAGLALLAIVYLWVEVQFPMMRRVWRTERAPAGTEELAA
jgi:Fuc2NAc and GlcNAc transferase